MTVAAQQSGRKCAGQCGGGDIIGDIVGPVSTLCSPSVALYCSGKVAGVQDLAVLYVLGVQQYDPGHSSLSPSFNFRIKNEFLHYWS